MHLIITDAWLAKSKAMHLSGTKLILVGLLSALCVMLVSVGLYHWVFLTAARAGWPHAHISPLRDLQAPKYHVQRLKIEP